MSEKDLTNHENVLMELHELLDEMEKSNLESSRKLNAIKRILFGPTGQSISLSAWYADPEATARIAIAAINEIRGVFDAESTEHAGAEVPAVP